MLTFIAETKTDTLRTSTVPQPVTSAFCGSLRQNKNHHMMYAPPTTGGDCSSSVFSYSSQTTVRASNTDKDIEAPFGGGYGGYGNWFRGVPNRAWLSSLLHRGGDSLRSVIETAAMMSLGHVWIPPANFCPAFREALEQYIRDKQIPIPLETAPAIVPPPVVQPSVVQVGSEETVSSVTMRSTATTEPGGGSSSSPSTFGGGVGN